MTVKIEGHDCPAFKYVDTQGLYPCLIPSVGKDWSRIPPKVWTDMGGWVAISDATYDTIIEIIRVNHDHS